MKTERKSPLSFRVPFFETSAKNDIGVDEVFSNLARQIKEFREQSKRKYFFAGQTEILLEKHVTERKKKEEGKATRSTNGRNPLYCTNAKKVTLVSRVCVWSRISRCYLAFLVSWKWRWTNSLGAPGSYLGSCWPIQQLIWSSPCEFVVGISTLNSDFLS